MSVRADRFADSFPCKLGDLNEFLGSKSSKSPEPNHRLIQSSGFFLPKLKAGLCHLNHPPPWPWVPSPFIFQGVLNRENAERKTLSRFEPPRVGGLQFCFIFERAQGYEFLYIYIYKYEKNMYIYISGYTLGIEKKGILGWTTPCRWPSQFSLIEIGQ